MKPVRTIAFAALVLILVASCIRPLYPHEMFLQHSITVVALAILWFLIPSKLLSDTAYLLVCSYLLLHIIGARWIYSYVPYNTWIHYVTGWDLHAELHLSRNHYDRFVHLMFGILMMIPFGELLQHKFRIPRTAGLLFAYCTILSISMLYEVFEWLLTLLLSPQAADSYNGQQGDMWDAQKDMGLALLGASAVLLFRGLKRHSSKKQQPVTAEGKNP